MPRADLLAQAGFASAWMLLWATAAAVPIVIHFLTRRRQVTVSWAAMQLLLAVLEREAKRVRIEQLLLLILRVLILLTLAVALARPFLQQGNLAASLANTKPKLWILGIDASYSMGYRPSEPSRFQTAKEKAIDIVESSLQGDAFALLEVGSPCRAVIRRPSFDKDETLAELRKMKLLDTGCDVSGWLQIVQEIMAEAKDSDTLPTDVRILFLSDMGADSWEAVTSGPNARALAAISHEVSLEVVSLAVDEINNVAVTAFQPISDRARVGRNVDVSVQVQNYGATAVSQLPIQLKVDDQTVESKFVDLAAGESRQVRFGLVPKSLGKVVLAATIPADALAADNERRAVVDVRSEDRILFVEDRPGDARLLSMSLQPRVSSQSSDHFRTVSSIDLLSFDLSAWDAVVLSDLATLNRPGIAKLAAFVNGGGSLIAAFGSETQAPVWNAASKESGLLGFQFDAPSEESNWNIDALDYKSPVVAPFAGFPDAGLLTTPIFRYWNITPSEPNTLITDLALTNGSPLIVRKPTGQGWAASILSMPDSGNNPTGVSGARASWNAIATWPSFVPLMQQLSHCVLNTNVQNHNLLAGQPMRGDVVGKPAAGTNGAMVTVTCPDGSQNEVFADQLSVERTMPWQYTRTQTRGIYLALEPDGSIEPYAVNVDPVESSLESVSLARLAIEPSSDKLELQATRLSHAAAGQSDGLARMILSLLLVLLLAESFSAWWIGRRIG